MSQDWKAKKLEALVAASGEAIRRTRYIFLAINVAGLMMLSASFNAYLSWGRHMDELRPRGSPPVDSKDFLWVNVDVIGLRFHVYDLQIVGTLAMSLLAIWWYFSLRRENHVISEVVAEAEEALQRDRDCAQWLLHAVGQRMVFNPLWLDPEGQPAASKEALSLLLLLLGRIPCYVPLVVILCDVCSLFVAHPFGTIPDQALIPYLLANDKSLLLLEIVLRIGFALLLALGLNRFLCEQSETLAGTTHSELLRLAMRLRPPAAEAAPLAAQG